MGQGAAPRRHREPEAALLEEGVPLPVGDGADVGQARTRGERRGGPPEEDAGAGRQRRRDGRRDVRGLLQFLRQSYFLLRF